jgi:hypothetical protein
LRLDRAISSSPVPVAYASSLNTALASLGHVVAIGGSSAKVDLLGEIRTHDHGTLGVALPTRLRFSELPQHMIPRGESELSVRVDSNHGVDSAFIHSGVERWRGAKTGASATRHRRAGRPRRGRPGQPANPSAAMR